VGCPRYACGVGDRHPGPTPARCRSRRGSESIGCGCVRRPLRPHRHPARQTAPVGHAHRGAADEREQPGSQSQRDRTPAADGRPGPRTGVESGAEPDTSPARGVRGRGAGPPRGTRRRQLGYPGVGGRRGGCGTRRPGGGTGVNAEASRSKSAPDVARGSQPKPTMTAVSPGASLERETLPPLFNVTLMGVPPSRARVRTATGCHCAACDQNLTCTALCIAPIGRRGVKIAAEVSRLFFRS